MVFKGTGGDGGGGGGGDGGGDGDDDGMGVLSLREGKESNAPFVEEYCAGGEWRLDG